MKLQTLLEKSLDSIQELTSSMSNAKDFVIREHGIADPLNNILSYDVEDICNKLQKAIEEAAE